MKKTLLKWWLVSTITFITLFIFILKARYLYALNSNYITLIEYDSKFFSSLVISAFLIFIAFCVLYMSQNKNNDLLERHRLLNSIIFLPMYPILTELIWFLLDVYGKRDDSHNYILATKLINAQPENYTNPLSYEFIVNHGSFLRFGSGATLTFTILIALLISQIVILTMFSKMKSTQTV